MEKFDNAQNETLDGKICRKMQQIKDETKKKDFREKSILMMKMNQIYCF